MIFGRGKKPDNSEIPAVTPAAAQDPVVTQPPVPPAPTAATTTPVPAATATAPVAPATQPAKMAATPAPAANTLAQADPDEQELRARRALGAKMVAASFGEIISIFMQSKIHRHLSLSDLEWLVVPPVLTQQFVLAETRKEDGAPVPVAVALWASVSPEVDEKLSANMTAPLRLRPDEWKSGDILWLIEAIGPAKVLGGMMDNLHKNVFKGRPLKFRTRDKDGKPVIQTQKFEPAVTPEGQPAS